MIELHPIDWFIIIWYLIICTSVGLYYSKIAGKKIEEYFIAGRSLPWWIAGTSMVATTFAADTPLAVTGLTAEHGIAGNWFWWSFMFGAVLTAVFYAKLWRRSEAITDIEFTELRYSGKPAAALRGFRSIHMGIFINAIIMGWVLLAMAKIFSVVLGWPRIESTVIAALIALLYTTLAGLRGVTITDVVQFILAMLGCVVLAIMSLAHVGWISGLHSGLVSTYGPIKAHEILSFAPSPASALIPFAVFLTYLTLNWYASWYPGAEPGGGGYVAQRMLSCKTEKDSKLATVWFAFAHYVIRPWPWIIVALVSMVVWPNLADPEMGYPLAMSTFLPIGLRGLIVAAFLAAFMSTMSTHINWGASYIVRDLYQRFLKKDASPKHYVAVGRGVSMLQLVLAILVSFVFPSIADAWKFLIVIGSGTGLVYLLRWFWWRINAWSEISAMCGALVIGLSVTFLTGDWVIQMWVTFITVTAIWLSVTLLTQPESEKTLDRFYEKIHPGGFWQPVQRRIGIEGDKITVKDWSEWVLGCAFILTSLMGFGLTILGPITVGIPLLVVAAIFFVVFYRLVRR